MKIKVRSAASDDVYKDIIHIPESCRHDAYGHVIPEGTVCKVAYRGRATFALVRGSGNSSEKEIRIDERLRNLLGFSINEEVDLQLKKVGLWGQFRWAWNASDPAYRVAARMGGLSVILGLTGLLLGLLSLRACR